MHEPADRRRECEEEEPLSCRTGGRPGVGRWNGRGWNVRAGVVGLAAVAGSMGLVGVVLVPGRWWVMIWPWVAAAIGGVQAWRMGRRVREWQRSVERVTKVLEEIRGGEAPIDELSGMGGPMAGLVGSVQEILRELRQQKAELAAVELEIRQRVAQRTTALERMIGSLRQQANRDALTGLYNRRMLNEHLGAMVGQARESGAELCLLMLDLDNFKTLNDTLGHAAGDEVLRTIGQIIRSCTREQDLAFRCGGDEFVLVLPDCGVEEGRGLARRLMSLIDGLGRTVKTPRPLGASIGVIGLSEMSAEDLQGLLIEADKRLYSTKAERKQGQHHAAA